MLPDSIDAIHRYTESVRRGEIRPTCNLCPRCHEEPREFRLHDRRERSFLVPVGRIVRRVLSLLSRWKCPLCEFSFTVYPPFAVPRKRYVRESIFELVERYADDDELSYRGAVRIEGMPVFYEEGRDGRIDERTLSHSTLHRWCPFFGSLGATVGEASKLLRGASPVSTIFRKVFPISPRKYRSEARRTVLVTALKMLAIEREYRALFERSIFPELATACGWI